MVIFVVEIVSKMIISGELLTELLSLNNHGYERISQISIFFVRVRPSRSSVEFFFLV